MAPQNAPTPSEAAGGARPLAGRALKRRRRFSEGSAATADDSDSDPRTAALATIPKATLVEQILYLKDSQKNCFEKHDATISDLRKQNFDLKKERDEAKISLNEEINSRLEADTKMENTYKAQIRNNVDKAKKKAAETEEKHKKEMEEVNAQRDAAKKESQALQDRQKETDGELAKVKNLYSELLDRFTELGFTASKADITTNTNDVTPYVGWKGGDPPPRHGTSGPIDPLAEGQRKHLQHLSDTGNVRALMNLQAPPSVDFDYHRHHTRLSYKHGNGKVGPHHYHSTHEWDIGLCFEHFATSAKCPYGKRCDWQHDIAQNYRGYICYLRGSAWLAQADRRAKGKTY